MELCFRNLDERMAFYNSDIHKYLDSMTVYLVKGAPGKDFPIPLEGE